MRIRLYHCDCEYHERHDWLHQRLDHVAIAVSVLTAVGIGVVSAGGVLFSLGIVALAVSFVVAWHRPELIVTIATIGSPWVLWLARACGLQRGAAIASAAAVIIAATLSFTRKLGCSSRQLRSISFFEVSLLAITIQLLLEVPISAAPRYGVLKAMQFVVFVTLPALAMSAIRSPRDDTNEVIRVWWLSGVLISLVALLPVIASTGESFYRIYSAWSDPIAFSRVVGSSALIGIWYMLTGENGRNPLKVLLQGFATSIAGAAALLSGTRGTILALAIATVFLMVRLPGRSRKVVVIGIALGVLVAAGAMVTKGAVASGVLKRYFVGGDDANIRERLVLWGKAWEMFVESPIVGHGTGSFAAEVCGMDERWYPHNVIMEIASELGLVGISLFALSVLRPLCITLRRQRFRSDKVNQRMSDLLVSLTIFGLVAAMFSSDLPFNYYIWFPIALLRRPATRPESQGKDGI